MLRSDYLLKSDLFLRCCWIWDIEWICIRFRTTYESGLGLIWKKKKDLFQGRFLTTIEGWAGRYPGWALGGGGGGGGLDIYTVDIAILTIVCYMYTGEKKKRKNFYGQPRISCTWTFFLYWIIIIKTPLCSLSLNHCFYTGDFFQLTFLFIPNKA